MLELIRLRVRRDALVLLGLGATVLVSLPFSRLVTPSHYATRQVIDAAWAFWLVAGLPGFAALLGGAAGAELAGDTSRAAENLLPLPASARAWAALASAGVQLAALTALIFALRVAMTVEISDVVDLAFRAANLWQSGALLPYVVSFAGCVVYLLLASVIAGYATGNGVLGGILGVALAGACFFALAAGQTLEMVHPLRVSYSGWTALALAAAVAGGIFSLRRVALTRERGETLGVKRLASAGASAVAGTLLAAGAFAWKANDVDHHRVSRIVGPAGPASGALLKTLIGEVWWQRSDGSSRRLLAGNGGIFTEPWDGLSFAWEGGSLWALRRAPNTYDNWELWSGDPDNGLEKKALVVSGGGLELGRRAGKLVVRDWYDGRWAPLPLSGPAPDWRRPADHAELERAHGTLELVPLKRSWSLRERPEGDGPRVIWRGEGEAPDRYGAIGVGGWWTSAAGRIRWRLADGRVLGPSELPHLSDKKGFEAVLRADGDRLWLVGDSTLVVLKAGSREPAAKIPLPDAFKTFALHERPVLAVRDGFFWHTTDALYFVDWEGKARKLGR